MFLKRGYGFYLPRPFERVIFTFQCLGPSLSYVTVVVKRELRTQMLRFTLPHSVNAVFLIGEIYRESNMDGLRETLCHTVPIISFKLDVKSFVTVLWS